MKQNVYVGSNPLRVAPGPIAGARVVRDGEDFYQITDYDRMRPFFLSIVSGSDHWMFISSTGSLTAGRRNPDVALFPYYTDDKIHDAAEITGSKTLLIVEDRRRRRLWEPLSDRYRGVYRTRRNLYKNRWGNKLIFEECNEDLGLTFRYGWFSSDQFGFVRKAWLICDGPTAVRIHLLDGIQNLMPSGVGSQFQLEKSTLLDAYKRNELLPETGLALLRLSSIPIDRPEPAEALRTTVAWSVGLNPTRRLLSSVQLDRFRLGLPLRPETDVRAERGAYFLEATLALRPGRTAAWIMGADVDCGPSEVVELERWLRQPRRLVSRIEADIGRGTRQLEQLVASADGFQKTARPLSDVRHGNNVLFNIMRGGVFAEGYRVDSEDLLAFVRQANRRLAARQARFFRRLKRDTAYAAVVARAGETRDPQLERLCREYLPLAFSRRHGDPSRPWNRFSIAPRKADGSWVLNYEGNWRDIFQNWEALAVSFPHYVSGMICRFVSASTADGYNPYRLTRDGIDWEVINPSDPWAHIGYWGDHQLIYLLKLLEILQQYDPATLRAFLTRDLFAYANVPYRIKPYDALLADPKETVAFAPQIEELVRQRVRATGADGRLLWDETGEVRLVNLSEKLIVAVLAKLSNFIPEAGIWMNTQRPEWNDANNALVGNGVSLVTLCYLRRYLAFCREVLAPVEHTDVPVSAEVGRFLQEVRRVLERRRGLLSRRLDDRKRKQVLDELGRAGSRYRRSVYASKDAFSGRRQRLQASRLMEFFALSLEWVDHSIRANRRPDRLYQAYNLIRVEPGRAIRIRRLYEMLEGQVAVLSSGRLTAEESIELLAALRHSAMYRKDQHSYLLYPNRQLPRFVEKNNLPPRAVRQSRLLRQLLADGDRTLVERDGQGRCHFAGSLTNTRDVRRALEELARRGYGRLVRDESALVLASYERLFDHESFTGRSGTFFGYEGLGCIYWHMVSKLLLAVQETFHRAAEADAPPAVLRQLAASYYDIRAGIGDQKSPGLYGAFPMDPYSHTPAHAGARQPGLTGQVKEDILCRFGELGVFVRAGQIEFRPRLLRPAEFLGEPADFRYYDVAGVHRRLRLPPQALAFTYCQIPVVYRLARANRLTVSFVDGTAQRSEDLTLDRAISEQVFDRTSNIRRITVELSHRTHNPAGSPVR